MVIVGDDGTGKVRVHSYSAATSHCNLLFAWHTFLSDASFDQAQVEYISLRMSVFHNHHGAPR
jgi:hypothetical protein